MKFLRIILIGSLSLSTVTPSYGLPSMTSAASSVANWWQSQSNFQRGCLIGACISGAVVCYLIKRYREPSSPRHNIILNVLWDPMREEDAQVKLREIIASGYRLTTDPFFKTPLGRSYLEGPFPTFVQKAIEDKPYLIPLLKELGATPMLIKVYDNSDPLFYCFAKAAEQATPLAFNTLLESYPLSEEQWNQFIKYLKLDDNYLSINILTNIIPAIPAGLVNNTYGSSTLLWHCVRNYHIYCNFGIHSNFPSTQHLLDKGADPLISDTKSNRTVLDLLTENQNDSSVVKASKKRLKTLIEPYAKIKKNARITAIGNVTGLSIDPINLCSAYEYDTTGDHLLNLITSDQEEEVIHKKIRSVVDNDTFGKGYVLNKGDAHGETPLMHAATRGYGYVTQELMDCGADIEVCNKEGENALFFAAFFGRTPIVKAILEQAVKNKIPIPTLINKQCCNGDTPLIQAIYSKSAPESTKEATVRLLLEHGADTTVRKQDWFGRGASDYTSYIQDESTRKRIIALLEHPPRPAAQPVSDMILPLG